MHRIINIVLTFSILINLSGCSLQNQGRQKGLESLVSAIGFDNKNGNIAIFIETINTNSEDSEADRKLTLNKGVGKTLSVAFQNANEKSIRPFMFSHCAVVVIGEGLNSKRFREICRFLYNKDEINLSTQFIYTENAEELLSCDTVGSVAVGYDLSDALKKQVDYNGTDYPNKFYNIEAKRKSPANIFYLPRFTVNDKEYICDGSVIFKNDEPVLELDRQETVICSLINGNQHKGVIEFEGKTYKLKKSKAEHKFSYNKSLKTDICLQLKISGDDNPKQAIEKQIQELYFNSKLYNTDIFMLSDKLNKEERAIWDKIKRNYSEIYKKSILAVKVK